MIAATPLAHLAPPDTVRRVTVAPVEEPLVSTPDELPPLILTGDDETDEALALLRTTTQAIHAAQDRVAELSDERKRLVLDLRRRIPPVLFRTIANAAGSTDQTIYKIHREALRDERDRADAAEAERLGYPTVDEYRQARATAPTGTPTTPSPSPTRSCAPWSPCTSTGTANPAPVAPCATATCPCASPRSSTGERIQ
jgi:hypothetical protein